MKEQIIQNLGAVIQALNTVTVSGKNNLSTVAGSISVLEELYTALSKATVTMPEPEKKIEDE